MFGLQCLALLGLVLLDPLQIKLGIVQIGIGQLGERRHQTGLQMIPGLEHTRIVHVDDGFPEEISDAAELRERFESE